ncbi:uncharacterized protein LOC143621316 [Bidens hawaiensis]|uniref:uncharacterized protein LOC143621316 n=1 Tax=Bidens hawaiensis TaxID=980011 RepID=UPI00404B95B8
MTTVTGTVATVNGGATTGVMVVMPSRWLWQWCRKVGTGHSTHFWLDVWFGKFTLKDIFPNLYKLAVKKTCMVNDLVSSFGSGLVFADIEWSKSNLSLEESSDLNDLKDMVTLFSFNEGKEDGWRWTGDSSGRFTVQAMRRLMADSIHGDDVRICGWETWVPIKINCFVWRLLQNKIPVAPNLIARGMPLLSSNCRVCALEVESTKHVFLDCSRAKARLTSLWCGWDFTGLDSFEHLLGVLVELQSKSRRRLLLAIIYSTLWFIWKQRDEKVFKARAITIAFTVEEIKRSLFGWFKLRTKHKDVDWSVWADSPLSCIYA